MASTQPSRVEITEVGTRDGFQMESEFIPTQTKIDVLNGLIAAGLRRFEVSSFVSPRAIPQLQDAEAVIEGMDRVPGLHVACLVPNARGAERAARAKVDEMVTFVSASESHNQANLNTSVDGSLAGLDAIMEVAAKYDIAVHGAVAVAFGCPFEGEVRHEQVHKIVGRYAQAGIGSVTLGDTTGMATPPLVRGLVQSLRERYPHMDIVLHFHNTRGVGLVNVMTGLELGVTRYESSIAGLGGCPFAPGASGNVCTEDMVYMLHEMGVETGIDLERLLQVARQVERVIGRTLPGQVMKSGHRLALHRLEHAPRARG